MKDLNQTSKPLENEMRNIARTLGLRTGKIRILSVMLVVACCVSLITIPRLSQQGRSAAIFAKFDPLRIDSAGNRLPDISRRGQARQNYQPETAGRSAGTRAGPGPPVS